MKYCWIEDIEEFQLIADEWDKTLLSSGNYNPFLLSDFIVTFWKHYRYNRRLFILVIREGRDILGGIPLYLERESSTFGFARVLRYVGKTAANYTEPLYGTSNFEMLPLLINALFKRKDWDALHLTDVRSESRLIMEYNKYPHGHMLLSSVLQDHMNWAIDLSVGKDKYMQSIPKKLKKDLMAKRRYADKNYGKLKFRQIGGKEEIERYFDLYAKFSCNTFRLRYEKSAFENQDYLNFIRELLIILDEKQRLDAHILLAGDKVLAISFAYRFGRGFNWILTGYNYEYKYVRPGYLMIEELINELFNRGETYYNWYGHIKFYKIQWCNSQSPLFQFFLIRPNLRGIWYWKLQQIKSRLKADKNFMDLASKIRRIPRRLKQPIPLI